MILIRTPSRSRRPPPGVRPRFGGPGRKRPAWWSTRRPRPSATLFSPTLSERRSIVDVLAPPRRRRRPRHHGVLPVDLRGEPPPRADGVGHVQIPVAHISPQGGWVRPHDNGGATGDRGRSR